MNSKIAIIDCGTNTFHLYIVQVTKGLSTPLVKEKTLVKIGRGGITNNVITPEACTRAINAISSFQQYIEQEQPDAIYGFATSAFRNATNGQALRERIASETGISLSIIDGETEAELIYSGVKSGLDFGADKVMVMDIGGGSVEFIIGNKHRISWKGSFEIGAQRLLDLFHKTDPITENEIRSIKEYLDVELAPMLEKLHHEAPKTLVGSSGTFDTLSDIYCRENNIIEQGDEGEVPFDIVAFHHIYQTILTKNREDRLNIPGMIEMRVDMIVVATVLIDFILQRHDFERIRVSSYALKEGVLYQIMNGQI